MTAQSERGIFHPDQDYQAAFRDLVIWNDAMRDVTPRVRIRPIDREFDKQTVAEYQDLTLAVFPDIERALDSARVNNELVFHDMPIGEYQHSPFARMYRGIARTRRLAIEEAMMRGENFSNLPEDVRKRLSSSWGSLRTLPQPEAPDLDPMTVRNISALPSRDVVVWEKLLDGLGGAHDLLKRTIAVKNGFSESSPVLGYNKRTVDLANVMLVTLDTVASCTPWQMDWDPQGYLSRVSQAAYGFFTTDDRLKMGEHLGEGKMWSEEMRQNTGVAKWMSALETGIRPY